MAFIAFPDRKDSIISENIKDVVVSASGSIGFYMKGKCQQTYPNQTLTNNAYYDWCSNVGKKGEANPWISYYITGKKMKLTGYSIRNGCCRYAECCCIDDNTKLDSHLYCCCALYSFALQGSNDNQTWKTIHTIEQKKNFYYCKYETYEFPETEFFRFVRFVQLEEYPNCPFCMAINQIEFYGSTTQSFDYLDNIDENEESVSIIGKIKRNV